MKSDNLNRRFRDVCLEKTDKCAVIAVSEEYSFQRLLDNAEHLAVKIKEIKRKYGYANIAVYKSRNYELLVTVWAIIIAGAVYIPIDTGLNTKRIKYILEDSKANVIITDEKYLTQIKDVSVNCMLLNIHHNYDFDRIGMNEAPYEKIEDNGFSYIMYTSGTTGYPKGIQITSDSLMAFIDNFNNVLPENSYNRILAHTSISFDISLVEIIYAVITGKTIVLCNDDEKSNVRTILRLIDEYKVDCLQVTPSLLSLLMEMSEHTKLTDLRYILVGGEEFTYPLFQKISAITDCEVINLYGPTEATVWCMWQKQNGLDKIYIGNSIGNNNIFLMDSDDRIVYEANKAGEICISGYQLAECYFGQPELTKQKFIKNWDIYPERFYKTGDLAYYDENRQMIYLGRMDNQIKINGKRIELEDIERMILEFDGISDNVVVHSDKGSKKILQCFYKANREFLMVELRAFLKDNMPKYMIPKKFYKIEDIPLTNSGKKDRIAINKEYGEYL